MSSMKKSNLIKCWREEKGQALVIVLALLLIGSLTLPPVLAHIGTSLKSGVVYESKTDELYAADSGIEDAIWQVKFNRLEALLDDPPYDAYDFDNTWSYDLSEPMNSHTVSVSLENVWIPKGLAAPSVSEARDIIESNKLIVAGTATTDTECRIKIDFSPDEGEEGLLLVDSLGIWLPYGFSYAGSCNLEGEPYNYDPPTVSNHAGGQAVVWDFTFSENFTSFPGVELQDFPQSAEITFDYTANVTGDRPVTISWIDTNDDILPFSWDIDTRMFQITSTAGDTTIEAYAARCELRQMASAIAGDYKAIGNSLMGGNPSRRSILYGESSTELTTIPNGDEEDDVGDVLAAYLYWSGSYKESVYREAFSAPIWGPDPCDDYDNWDNPSETVWEIDDYDGSDWFCGHYSNGDDEDARYLEKKTVVNLDGYSEGEVVVEWYQYENKYYEDNLEPADGLTFQITGDNGSTWSDPITAFYDDIKMALDHNKVYFYYVIPQDYLTSLFKIKIHLENFEGSNEYCYIDEIAVAEITADIDTTAFLKIDGVQVYLLDGEAKVGSGVLNATKSSAVAFEKPGEYVYACYVDITKLVQAYSEMVEDEWGVECRTGNAEYTVGGVDADVNQYRSYAGWSIIVVYSSPETAGHQLYLYDTCAANPGNKNLDFDFDGEPGGDITGFVVPEPIEGEEVAATLTCFVGEGDLGYAGDFLAFNAPEEYRDTPQSIPDEYKLWDGDGSLDNVWDSDSEGVEFEGVDVDTFTILWDDEDQYGEPLIKADDTEAHIDMPSGTDNWFLIYMILSVRSETITGSTAHYVIRSQ